jgi:FdhE protein
MSSVGAPFHDPIPIGKSAEPPFARVPDPNTLFEVRGGRLRTLSEGHPLAPYLRLVAALSDIQHRVQDGLAPPDMPAQDVCDRAREFGMPPLDRSRFTADAAFEATLDRLLALSRELDMPEPARAAVARAIGADPATRDVMVRAVLADSIPADTLADHLFFAAALQVHFARQAARLDATHLVAVGDGACPACGAPPVSSIVVGWPGAENTRFCACSLCSTLWHYVRVKCTLCGSTKGITYCEFEGNNGHVRAEACDSCRRYVKILQQQEDPALDPFADDVANLALDLKVSELGYGRGGVNPFMLGY